jgi:hypothetical protein
MQPLGVEYHILRFRATRSVFSFQDYGVRKTVNETGMVALSLAIGKAAEGEMDCVV